MVGDQAKKGNKSAISVSSSVQQTKKASNKDTTNYKSPLEPRPLEPYQAPWIPVPCKQIANIRGICKKLSGFCKNASKIVEVLDGKTPSVVVSSLVCDDRGGRCSKDVLLAKCPIRAMDECRNLYKNCKKKNCKEFDNMAVCPFSDKASTSRCDYWFRLWESSATNKNKKKNIKNAVCMGENYTGGKSSSKLPKSVEECCNSVPLPDGSQFELSVKPIYKTDFNLDIGGYGFGVRFYNEGKDLSEPEKKENSYKQQIRGEHKGVDLHCRGYIYSVADGEIVESRTYGGGGWVIKIKHPVDMTGCKTEFFSRYMHMSYPPELNRNYYNGQLIGGNPSDKSIIKAPFWSTVLYKRKCSLTGIWGEGKLYDVVLGTKGTPALTGGSEKQPLVLPLDEPVELNAAGGSLTGDVFDKHINQHYEGKKGGSAVNGNLFFVRLWIPYTMGVDSEIVKAGQVIGLEANTDAKNVKPGREHLHFELLKDINANVYYNCYKVLTADTPNPPRYPE